MPLIRTPEERFANLPEYDFRPNYKEIEGCGVHYVDEGRHPGAARTGDQRKQRTV
jgi:haloalkane dehalogenase